VANCLAGFLLTRKLLLLLMASPAACVVNVALAGQQEIDFSDVVLRQQFSGQRAHRQSKLAQILIPIDLAGEFEGSGVSVNALHPATFMNTSIVNRAGIVPTSRVEDGGEAILRLATVPALASHRTVFRGVAGGRWRHASGSLRLAAAGAAHSLRVSLPLNQSFGEER